MLHTTLAHPSLLLVLDDPAPDVPLAVPFEVVPLLAVSCPAQLGSQATHESPPQVCWQVLAKPSAHVFVLVGHALDSQGLQLPREQPKRHELVDEE